MGSLKNQTVFITGGSKGIGAACAVKAAGLGANVAIAALEGPELIEVTDKIKDNGGNAISMACDVSSYESVKNALKTSYDTFGGIDIVYANAGAIFQRTTVEDSDVELWAKTLQVGLIGAYHTIHAAIPYLKERGGGKIITIGSGRGRRAGGLADYSCMKAGVWMLARNLAVELMPYNILVNEMLPGPVLTDMNKDRQMSSAPSARDIEYYKTPDEVADLFCYVASFDNKTGPTGQTFSLNRREI